MNNEQAYWVAFNHINGIGAVRTARLLEYFGSLSGAWQAERSDLNSAGLPPRAVDSILSFRAHQNPQELLDSILKRHIHVTTLPDDDYPHLLKTIDNPPPVLYYVGTLPEEDEYLLSIVGTRSMTAYGSQVAESASSYLALNGVGIVSGLARGIDGMAHRAALKVNGRTYAVMANGVDHIYPEEHRDLAKEIVRHGAILSEYAPGTKPDKRNFPQRNRIISGMSMGCFVVEAGERSGSLITARFAAEQGREVFVAPGNITAVMSRGANRLLRDGATPINEIKDLLTFVNSEAALHPVRNPKPIQMGFTSPEEKLILNAVYAEPLHIDEIARRTGLSITKVSSSIILLELGNFIIETAPQTYMRRTELI